MANFIYIKEFAKPIQVGEHKDTGEPLYFTTWPLVPMLIIDAPDLLNIPKYKGIAEKYEMEVADFNNERKEFIEEAIPLHSNKAVYEWLKSKGITPEPELLIEFDGEYEIQSKYLFMDGYDEGNCIECGKFMQGGKHQTVCRVCCNQKVAIIKDIEVKQESEWEFWDDVAKIIQEAFDKRLINKVLSEKYIITKRLKA